MKGKRKGKIEKHRGNPHGNAPQRKGNNGQVNSDDQLRQSVTPGVSQSERNKQ
jgi:hypothetical protein